MVMVLWVFLILMNTRLRTSQTSPSFVSTTEGRRCEQIIGISLSIAHTIFRIEQRDASRLRVGFSKYFKNTGRRKLNAVSFTKLNTDATFIR